MDGNAQNMFHGNHQGDAYYRYDANAAATATPRAMGPPGGYPRHRPPHPLQQQPQYPSYQPSAENLYAMGTDQHTGMGMGDLGGWAGAPTPGQAGTYPGPGLGAYGHPQTAPSPQRQSQSQSGYRQHMSAYPQQEQQKLSFSTQQSMMGGMMQQPGYVGLNQQQSQQQRISQHYPQAGTHPMYPGAPQSQSTAQPYGAYASTGMQHQPGRPPQHVAYSHASLDQPSYGQHVPSSSAPGHLLSSQQQPPPQMPGHPPQNQQSHIGQPSQNHLPVTGQTQQPQSLHPSQVVHPSQQQSHPSTSQSSLQGLPSLQSGPTVSQQQSQSQTSTQSQSHLSTQHMHSQGQGPQGHPGLLHPNANVTSQHQNPPGGHSLGHSMVSAYNVHNQSQQQQQSPYMSTAKPQPATQLSSSPQYRAPFPQLSPQMSPRPPQMSPHPQMSPRPVISPAKPPQQQQSQLQSNQNNAPSPHHTTGLSGITSPRPPTQQPQPIQPPSKNSAAPPVNTLQALEQMVMPSQNPLSCPVGGLDYPQTFRQQLPGNNPMSPMGPRMPMSPQHQQWGPLLGMQQANNTSLGNITTQSQHLYAQQSISHQPQQITQQQQQQQQQQTSQQISSQPLSEQLQHSINEITGQNVPVSQSLPPNSLGNQQSTQHLMQSQQPPQQQQQQQLSQPQRSPNIGVPPPLLNDNSLSDSSLGQQQNKSNNVQDQHSLIDTFSNVMETSSPQLKMNESNSNDSSHLGNNDTNSSIINNRPSSAGATDSNSNSGNQNMMFCASGDTNTPPAADLENSNQQLIGLQTNLSDEESMKDDAAKECFQEEQESSENSQDITELQPIQQHQLQMLTHSDDLDQQSSPRNENNNSMSNTDIQQIGEQQQHQMQPSQNSQQGNENSLEEPCLTDISAAINTGGHNFSDSLQNGLNMNTDLSLMSQTTPMTNLGSLQSGQQQSQSQTQSQGQQDQQQPQLQQQLQQQNQQQLPQTQPPVSQAELPPTSQGFPPMPTTNLMNTNQLLTQQQGMHGLPPNNHHGLPPNLGGLGQQPPMYDPQQQLMMGGVHATMPNAGIPGIPPAGHHMGPGLMPPHHMGPYVPGPVTHHQERAALQQQLQELYCMPPTPEGQEKIIRLQERLNMLTQHEANEQCNGGAQCILQSPLYSSAQMIESPQVSSTTGRGRGRGSSKPRKPRQKKGDKLQGSTDPGDGTTILPSTLPVSEDCVTQGAGDASIGLLDFNESCDISQDNSSNELDTSTDGKKKKPRKPRTPKDPNKPPKEKIPKEKKKKEPKEPKDPDRPKKKRGRKSLQEKQASELEMLQAENTNVSQGVETTDHGDEESKSILDDTKTSLNDDLIDYDDIPVSKISAKCMAEDSDKKNENDLCPENENSHEGSLADLPDGNTPKKKKKSGSSSSSAHKKKSSLAKSSSSKKRKYKSKNLPESDGEGDDLLATPPPSPPVDSEIDSSKRRSARNTQRKKYVDDVMLRFSDDETGLITSPPKKEKKSGSGSISGASSDTEKKDPAPVMTEEEKSNHELPVEEIPEKPEKPEESGKPNYVYVNTNDEDSMVVQHVLAVRIGKRELKPPPKKKIKKKKADVEGQETIPENKEATVTEEGKDDEKPKTPIDVKDEADNQNDKKDSEKEDVTPMEEGATDNNNEKIAEIKNEDEPVEDVSMKSIEDDDNKLDEKENTENGTATTEDEEIVSKNDEEKEETTEVNTKIAVDAKEDTTPVDETEKLESEEKVEVTEDDKGEEQGEKKEGEEKVVEDKKEEEDEEEETDEEDEEDENKEPVYIDVEEYMVKYRNFSYLHCEWHTEEELFKGDRRIASKIKRFQLKQAQQMNIFDNIEEEPFNPDFVEVDRVLDVSEHVDTQTGETAKHYLVKWKSLPYEDSTWELEEDVDDAKIEQFYKFTKLPPRSEWKPKKRPSSDQWKKLDQTPIYKNGNTLRPYQLEGLNWLKFSWYNGHNCILADEMGLGKTIQSLTFVHSVWEYGIRGPFLVIAPLSTIPNWQREFEGWTDMNVIVYHGSVTSKQMISEYEFFFKNDNGKVLRDMCKFNVLITTFEMIVTDYQDLRNFNWRVCVIDEAHRLKNRNCKLLEGLRQLNLEHRVLLSGTPLQNNVNELFSLLNFLEPSQFSSCDTFLNEFGSLKTEDEVQKLQALLKPMMLRRLKDDVEKSLAPKEETIVEVELTNIQKKYYRGILEQNFSFLKKGTTSANIPNLMNTMMELRKCCIHPYLLNGAEDQIQYDYKLTHGDDADAYYKNLINSAGKMVLIDKLLPKLKANGHRVLIFSQMVRCLDILEDYLMYRKYPFERIDGRIRGNLRQAAIDRFSRPDSDRFVFLLCTKAGGLGINLTAADTVIIYDSDWNPQNDLQAQARCHRIGQQKMVKIYRLLCRNTYEREMFDKASLKLGLDKAILQSMNTSQGKDSSNRQLSKKEIEDLLKKGAYGAVMDDDNAGDKFCEEDIDSILKRRTQVITMEYEKGSTFSKASFSASANRSDIKIDDPDFWNKWAKRADIDPNAGERDETEDLVISEPRRRTQIKRYGHDDGVMDMSEESSVENSDEDSIGLRSRRRKEKLARRNRAGNEDYIPRDRDTLAALGLDEIQYGSWAKSECFKVEKGLLSYGWGRWAEIQELGQFKRGWRDSDIEDCARVILLYCLYVYKGDEKIKNFIWDLITPTEDGEVQKISRDHSGLHNLVPRGRNAKGRNGGKSSQKDPNSKLLEREKIPGAQNILDPNHWSKDEKYDADTYLEGPYKKHLGRHANKVLLRVRMLYYIQHEVIGDLVQQINEGVNASDLPIRPPSTPDQMPSSWWNPNCCDKSLLVGTYKHGCEMYRQIRADPTLCFSSHIGPGDDAPIFNTNSNDDDVNSKHEDADEGDDDGTATKDSDSKTIDAKDSEIDRPSSSGLDDEENTNCYPPTNMPSDDTTWPSMQDLNTRLRRVITSYQRNYKKEELKQQQKAKLQALVATPTPSSTPSPSTVQVMSGAATPTTPNVLPAVSMTSSGSGVSMTGGVVSTSANVGSLTTPTSSQSQTSQMPTAADIGLMLSLLSPVDANQLANLDLNKLAMYLKMERQGKMEQAAKERERARLESLPKKWNRREENEFLRVLTGYGIDSHQANVLVPDWMKFKSLSKLDRKSDETLSDYYKVFIAMCKKQAGVKLSDNEKGLDGIIDEISEDHAKLVLDRLELLSKLREIARHPLLDERLKLCQNNFDTPDWWEPGRHDKELIAAVLKHGLYKSEFYIFNDPSFSFIDCERRFARELEAQIQRNIKIEPIPPIVEKHEVEVKKEEPVTESVPEEKEKKDGTEEALDKENENEKHLEMDTEEVSEKEPKAAEEEMKEVETDAEKAEGEDKEKADSEVCKEDEPKTDADAEMEAEEKDEHKLEENTEKEKSEEQDKTSVKDEGNDSKEIKEETLDLSKENEEETLKKEAEMLDLSCSGDPDDDEVMKEKEKAVEEECKKQAAELKARFPDLEVIQPTLKMKTEKDKPKIENMMMVRWFRDFALEKRISHIVSCVEKNQWPVGKSYSAYTGCQGVDLDIPLHETVKYKNIIDRRSATPDVITITTDQGVPKHLQAQITVSPAPPPNVMSAGPPMSQMPSVIPSNKKRKRHIAIDVETERAKLHALLNSTQMSGPKSSWGEEEVQDARRTPSLPLQPPPAHQHQPLTRQTSAGFSKPPPVKTPPSGMAPMDLSSSLPKVNMADMMKNPLDLSEVQDFSMGPKKSCPTPTNLSMSYVPPGKGKLDDTLSKLMKKNNCTIEEPIPLGKEKKRKKLDEIVLGLSAAKEQKTFPDPQLPSTTKKPQVTPSVSVTPANLVTSSASNQNQKPFTITVSVAGRSNKNNASSATGLAALQNMALGASSGASPKDQLNALIAQTMQADPQAFIKQQQKMIQQLPANSPQRKACEAMLSDMKQAIEFSTKYSSHDAKVNKWLAEQNAALNEQLNMDYRRSTRQQHSSNVNVPTSMPSQPPPPPQQQQQQQQQQMQGPKNLTGEENVPVINKQTGKRLSGNKAPQLKRLMPWLTENPAYEIDPKWLEHIQNPLPPPSPKPSAMDNPAGMGSSGSGSNKGHARSSSGSSNNSAGSGMGGNQSQSKKGRQSAIDQANAMQFASLAGLNPNLLAGLPGLAAFDPKNPLLMPFGGMPGLGGMGGLGNLNNMNLFANLAGLGGLGNLASMDAQSLAALMAAANGANLGSLGGSGHKPSNSSGGNKKGKQASESTQQSSSQQNQASKTPTSTAGSSSAANNAAFPFLFPNPSLLYPPLGLGGLNPYSLSSGMSAYDQLAQQYNLLNGGSGSVGNSQSSGSGNSRQSQGKSSNSRSNAMSGGSMGGSSSTGRGRNSSASSRNNDASQLSSLLMPTDPHLLESLSRMAGMDIAQASRLVGSNPSSDKRSSMSKDSHEKQAEKERQKWMESLARGTLPPDLAAIQAFTQGKLPMSSSKSSSKAPQMPLGMPTDISQAFLAEMAAQAVAAATTSSQSSKRSRDQEMRDAFEHFSKQQMDLYTKTLGLGSGISLIPTSCASTPDDHKPKRARMETHIPKDDIIPLNLGGSSDKHMRGDPNMDKVTLTPVAAASIASLPSQTTITIAPPQGSGASTSSGCSDGRSGLTMISGDTGGSGNMKHHSDTDIEELTLQQKLSKAPTPIESLQQQLSPNHHPQMQKQPTPCPTPQPMEHLPPTPPTPQPSQSAPDKSEEEGQTATEERRSGRLKRPRTSAIENQDICPPVERKRELRSSLRSRSNACNETLNLSTNSRHDGNGSKDGESRG